MPVVPTGMDKVDKSIGSLTGVSQVFLICPPRTISTVACSSQREPYLFPTSGMSSSSYRMCRGIKYSWQWSDLRRKHIQRPNELLPRTLSTEASRRARRALQLHPRFRFRTKVTLQWYPPSCLELTIDLHRKCPGRYLADNGVWLALSSIVATCNLSMATNSCKQYIVPKVDFTDNLTALYVLSMFSIRSTEASVGS